jgi:hypothetical protein
MKSWTLSGSQIFALLEESKIQPGPGSPFRDTGPASKKTKSRTIENKEELIGALTQVARPAEILGMVVYVPPGEPDYTWFYSSEEDMNCVLYREAAGNEHFFVWPVDRYLLLKTLYTPLMSDGMGESENIAFVIDRNGLEALAAIVDHTLEMGLLALLNRKIPPEAEFETEELMVSCNRSLQSTDLRWMIPRTMLLSPIRLAFSEQNILDGLQSLVERDLVEQQDSLFSLSPALSLTCALLGQCSGISALSTRYKSETKKGRSGNGWKLHHLAGIKGGLDRLWLLRFKDISSEEFDVEISCVNQKDMYEGLREGVFAPKQIKYCSDCGAALKSKAEFCSKCGHPQARK